MWFVLAVLAFFQITSDEVGTHLPKAQLEITVTGLRSDKGKVLLSVFNSEKGFPSDPSHAILTLESDISEGEAIFSFTLEKGAYAISVLHDENGNEQLDTNILGVPKEGIGVSNNVKGFMGPPPFKKAVFEIGVDTMEQSIQMTYL